MLVVLIRSIILYIAVLVSIRVMGKAEVAEMNSFDLVITLLIADIASIPIENNSIPLINGIAALSGLVLIQTLISYISLKNRKLSIFLSGNPSVLINNGKIDYRALKKERVTINELLEQLRIQGFFNLSHVQYAILETDGNLSVVPTSNYNSTPSRTYKHLPISLIIDGKIIDDGLKSANKDIKWLEGILKSYHINDIKDVLVCILDENDKIFIQPIKN